MSNPSNQLYPMATDFGFLGIEEEGFQFCFSSGCRGQFEDGASDVNCAIQFDWITVNGYTAAEEITTSTAAGMQGREIRSIRMYKPYRMHSIKL